MTAANIATYFATALILTAALMPPILWILRRALVADVATARSSHDGAVIRGGGVALVAGAALTMVIFADRQNVGEGLVGACLFGLGIGLLGLLDDLVSPPATVRLGAQIALATGLVLVVPGSVPDLQLPHIVGSVAVVLWLVSLTNAFNFMDGINGITATSATVIGVSLAISSLRWDAGIGIAAAAMAGAASGFLPFNAPNARVFLGDVGSYAIGGSFAALAVLAHRNGAPLIAIALPFSLYLADTGLTLVRRALSRSPLLEAHQDHSYQRLVHRHGWSHMRVVALTTSITAVLCGLGHLGAYNARAAGMCLASAALVIVGYVQYSLSA